MNSISLVLFDLGNVLAHIDFEAFWRRLGFATNADGAPYRTPYRHLTREYETGLISTNSYLDGLSEVFQRRFARSHLQEAVESIIEEPVEGMLEIVKDVSATRQTALVSNTNELHFQLSHRRFETVRILHKHYVSHELKVMKPDPGFYRSIIEDTGLPASSMVFVDDLEENVHAAKTLGMHGVRFENPSQFRRELVKLEILKT